MRPTLLVLLGAALAVGPVAAQSGQAPPSRALTSNDIAAGSFNTSFAGSRRLADGSRAVTGHMHFPAMNFPPVIFLSVTQIDVSGGRIAYSVADGAPVCAKPNAADRQCTGFDITVTEAPGTDIKAINVTYLAINALSPALFAHVTGKLTPQP